MRVIAVVVVAVLRVAAIMSMGVMLAVDIGVRAQLLEQPCSEKSRDEGAQQGQEDDGLVHGCRQPFMRLMSSTAMEPRLRK